MIAPDGVTVELGRGVRARLGANHLPRDIRAGASAPRAWSTLLRAGVDPHATHDDDPDRTA